MVKKLYQYKNGNTTVSIYEDGTKIRQFEGIPTIYHPESLDVKITNYCDLGCKFCHENSTVEGKHANIDKLKAVLVSLPAGVELALGGGNPLSHPEIITFLRWCKNKGLIANLTVNQGHLKEYYVLLNYLINNDLIKGVGISITSGDFTYIKQLKRKTNNIVYHVIAGVHHPSIIDRLKDLGNCKVLILGYKYFGRGKAYYSQHVEDLILKWNEYMKGVMKIRDCVVSFDNLALEQLDMQSKIPKNIWNRFYMGDDFTFTMYIDAVNQEYAPTSRSNDRVSFNEMSLFEYFLKNKQEA